MRPGVAAPVVTAAVAADIAADIAAAGSAVGVFSATTLVRLDGCTDGVTSTKVEAGLGGDRGRCKAAGNAGMPMPTDDDSDSDVCGLTACPYEKPIAAKDRGFAAGGGSP